MGRLKATSYARRSGKMLMLRAHSPALHMAGAMLCAGGVCCFRRRGEWWTRLSIDTEHMGRPVESLEVFPACRPACAERFFLIERWLGRGECQHYRQQAVTVTALLSGAVQIAEAALADEHVTHGDRLALQRRVLRLGKPPRRWRRPPWAAAALSEPLEVSLVAKPLSSTIGAPHMWCMLLSCFPLIVSDIDGACMFWPMLSVELQFGPRWSMFLWLVRGDRHDSSVIDSCCGVPACATGLKSRFLGSDNRECTVEELALQHYASAEGGAWQGEGQRVGARLISLPIIL